MKMERAGCVPQILNLPYRLIELLLAGFAKGDQAGHYEPRECNDTRTAHGAHLD